MQMDWSNGRLSLLLSDEELAAAGLCFEELDYQDPKTRRLLHALLRRAADETGYAPAGALLVEALPLYGGCLLLVTPETVQPSPPTAPAPLVFWVAGEDALLQLAAAWREGAPLQSDSALYRGEGGFWLVLYGDADAPALYECATPVAEGVDAAAFAAEHGEALLIGDALGHLHRQVARHS